MQTVPTVTTFSSGGEVFYDNTVVVEDTPGAGTNGDRLISYLKEIGAPKERWADAQVILYCILDLKAQGRLTMRPTREEIAAEKIRKQNLQGRHDHLARQQEQEAVARQAKSERQQAAEWYRQIQEEVNHPGLMADRKKAEAAKAAADKAETEDAIMAQFPALPAHELAPNVHAELLRAMRNVSADAIRRYNRRVDETVRKRTEGRRLNLDIDSNPIR